MIQAPKRLPRTILLTLGCSLLLAAAPACDKSKAEDGGDKAEGKEGAKKAEGEADAGEGGGSELDAPPKIDEEIMADLKAIVDNCEINPDGATVTKCKNKEKRALVDKFTKKEKDRGEAIDSFAKALGSDDPKLQTAAGSVMMSAMRAMPEVEKVSPAAAKRLVDAFAKAPKYQAAQSAPTVVHAANLSGNQEVLDALYAAIDSHEHKSMKSVAYPHLMAYGRLDRFDKVKELAASDDEQTAAAALEAWRNMKKPTDAEKKEVCPFVVGFLGDSRKRVFQQAGWGAIKCGGESVDKLLDEGEKRLSEKHEFTRDHYMVFRDVCFSFMGEKTAGQEEQCNRNYAFLQKAVDDEEVDAKARGLALFAIYYQRRDQATKDLAMKYKGHKTPEIAEKAGEIIESLDKHYLNKK